MPEELLENYEIGRVIGEGNYSIVRECKDINTGIQFALKIIDLQKSLGRVIKFKNMKLLKNIFFLFINFFSRKK